MKCIDGLPKTLKELQGLCKAKITELWLRYFKESPPKSGLNTIRIIWYKLQCEIHDLKIEQKHITKLNRYSTDPEKFVEKSFKAKYHIRGGTEIVKCFKGREHRVQVKSPDEFVYNGQSYKTLSAVALVICGNKVSGYDFLGLNNKLYQKSIVKGDEPADITENDVFSSSDVKPDKEEPANKGEEDACKS